MEYGIIKGTELLGPFTIDSIKEFLEEGLILEQDVAFDYHNADNTFTISDLMASLGIEYHIASAGNTITQLKGIGSELLLPFTRENVNAIKSNRKVKLLVVVGLSLSLLLVIAPVLPVFSIFYFVSLYFSLIWGLFFWFLFKTDEVSFKDVAVVFFGTQFLMIIYGLVGSGLVPESLLQSENILVSAISCILGIGLFEELIKLAPLYFVVKKYSNVDTVSVVFLGLMSGISFGVFEGVQYQMGTNFQLLLDNPIGNGYVVSFLLNIARLTCLPFLHAIWCGIGAHFIGLATVYKRYKNALFFIAVLIPSVLHGLYDCFCFQEYTILSIPVLFIGVFLLITYLNNKNIFYNQLTQ